METSVKKTLLVFVLTALAGIALHFLYAAFPNPLTALLAPVNESLWEHGKLLFWPILVVVLLSKPANATSWLLALLLAIGVMQGVGYLYHIVLQGTAFWVDIALYFLTLALAFLLPRWLAPLTAAPGVTKGIGLLVLALGGAFALFSFLPPAAILFQDLSAVHTWFTIPY